MYLFVCVSHKQEWLAPTNWFGSRASCVRYRLVALHEQIEAAHGRKSRGALGCEAVCGPASPARHEQSRHRPLPTGVQGSDSPARDRAGPLLNVTLEMPSPDAVSPTHPEVGKDVFSRDLAPGAPGSSSPCLSRQVARLFNMVGGKERHAVVKRLRVLASTTR